MHPRIKFSTMKVICKNSNCRPRAQVSKVGKTRRKVQPVSLARSPSMPANDALDGQDLRYYYLPQSQWSSDSMHLATQCNLHGRHSGCKRYHHCPRWATRTSVDRWHHSGISPGWPLADSLSLTSPKPTSTYSVAARNEWWQERRRNTRLPAYSQYPFLPPPPSLSPHHSQLRQPLGYAISLSANKIRLHELIHRS